MKLCSIRTLRNRNVYAHFPVIRMVVDLESLVEIPSNEIEGFNQALIDTLPGLRDHRCSIGAPGGFLQRLERGTYMAHIIEHTAIELQRMMGYQVSYGKARWNHDPSEYYIIYSFENEYAGHKAGLLAFELIKELANGRSFSPLSYLPEIRTTADALEQSEEQRKFFREIRRRNIPYLQKQDDVYQFGFGKDQQVIQVPRDIQISDFPNLRSLENQHFPIVAITGTNGKTTTTRMIASILRAAGFEVGSTDTDGICLNGKILEAGDNTGPRSAEKVLSNPQVTAAVLETARGGLIRRGLGYELSDVAVVTNISTDHLGLDGIETVEQLAKAKALLVETVKPSGAVVLNARDSYCKFMMERASAPVMLFSLDRNDELLRNHIRSGHRVIFQDEQKLWLAHGRNTKLICELSQIPSTLNGLLEHNTENAMAAFAAALSLNISIESMVKALSEFTSDEVTNKGRFNCFISRGVHIVLDYGHNPDGFKKIIAVLQLVTRNKLLGVIGVPGDREDEMIREAGRTVAGSFDRIFLKEDEDLRGRKPGEVPRLMIEGISESDKQSIVEYIADEGEALLKALEYAEAGDWVVVFFEKYDKVRAVLDELPGELQTFDPASALKTGGENLVVGSATV